MKIKMQNVGSFDRELKNIAHSRMWQLYIVVESNLYVLDFPIKSKKKFDMRC